MQHRANQPHALLSLTQHIALRVSQLNEALGIVYSAIRNNDKMQRIHISTMNSPRCSMLLASCLVLLALCTLPSALCSQSVGIGTTTPHPSAALDISSDTSGILIPRMTALQRDAINSPAAGLMVFVTNDMNFYCYGGSSWVKVGGDNTVLEDADGDTKIQVEEGMDDDTIRFDMGGTEFFKMANGRFEVHNTGKSVFIGRGAGASDNFTDNRNVAVGDSALSSSTTGFQNTAIGFQALYSNTGHYNTASGYQALYSNTGGLYNTASGQQALYSNTSGKFNTASGYRALYSNTVGVNNIASGYQALYSNTSGNSNIASGNDALYSNTLGNYNIASGYQALYSNTSGLFNIASGYQALYSHLNTSFNIGIGFKAMYSDTTGTYNIAVGRHVLYSSSNSTKNTAVGDFAMESTTEGSWNTAIGPNALNANQTGFRNVALGAQAGYSSLGDSSIYIGNKAGYFETLGNRLYIENSDADSANALIYGEFDNDLLRINGTLEAKFGFTDSDQDTKIQLEESTDDDIIRFDMGGTEYFRMDSGRLEVINTGGSVFIGRHAGMTDNFTDNVNVAIGDSALLSNNNGQRNTALGSETMYSNIGGNGNVAIGYQALRSSIYGGFNIASGNQAMFSNDSGNNNIASGFQALHNNISGSYNVALGSEAGFSSLGDGSVFIGNLAGYNETDGNRLYIENSDADSSSALIYGEFDNDILALNASVGIGTTTPTEKLHVSDGDVRISRATNMAQTRKLTIGGSRPGSGTSYAEIDFQNFDNNTAPASDYIGARIASQNGSGTRDGDLRFYTYDGLLQLRMTIVDTGAVGIGTSIPDEMLTVNGNASKSAGGISWAVSSDRRLKDIEGTYHRGLDEIVQLQPVFFRYKKDNPKGLQSNNLNVGFIAQDVQSVIPEAIDDSEEYLKLQADPIFWAMLNSIKELKTENDALKAESTELKAKLSRYQTDVEARLRALEKNNAVTSRK